MEINEINTETKEGKLLLMAVAALTCSPEVHVNGKVFNGRKTTPFEMLDEINEVAEEVFK